MKEILRKFRSRKFLITLWAIIMETYILIANRPEFIPIGKILMLIILLYLPVNAWQKKLINKKFGDNEDEK